MTLFLPNELSSCLYFAIHSGWQKQRNKQRSIGCWIETVPQMMHLFCYRVMLLLTLRILSFFLFIFTSLPNTPSYHSTYLFPEMFKKSENIANQEICVYNKTNEDSKESLLGNATALSGAMFCCLFTWWEKSHFEEYFPHKTFFFLSSSFATPASGNIYFPHTAQMN